MLTLELGTCKLAATNEYRALKRFFFFAVDVSFILMGEFILGVSAGYLFFINQP